jgi:hypothetical protein
MFKWLKKILPPPVSVFNRELQFLKEYIKSQNYEITRLQNRNYDLINKVESEQRELTANQNELSTKQSLLEKDFNTVFSDIPIGKQSVLLSNLEIISDRQKKYIESQSELIKNIDEIKEKLESNSLVQNELIVKVDSLIKKQELLEKKQEEVKLAAEMKTRNTPNTDLEKQLWALAGRQTAEYVSTKMYKCKTFSNPESLREFAVNQSGDGLYLEFGVYSGKSINQIATIKSNKTIYGFDSFDGLPETWRTGFEAGNFSIKQLPIVNENVKLIKGWFENTLPDFINVNQEACAFIHVDCDLYSSTKTVFEYLEKKIRDGSILLFDEYFNYPGWQDNEFRAFQEFIAKTGKKYEYIGYVKNYEQVAVKML